MIPKLKDDAIRDSLHQNLTMSNITNPKTIDEIIDMFVIKTLPKIGGEPYYEYVNDMI